MKKIGFIGSYDKIDMIINVAKILTTLDKKILVMIIIRITIMIQVIIHLII